MRGEGGPIGKVGAARAGNPDTVETPDPHTLSDGHRVRIAGGMYYVKSTGANSFSVHEDEALSKPGKLNGITVGDTIDRLNNEDWAIIAGINDYPGFNALAGPIQDAKEFELWTRRRAFVPDDQIMVVSQAAPQALDDAKPNLGDLEKPFLKLVANAAPRLNRKLGRRLYIFLSGHGIAPTLAAIPDYREAALLAANAKDALAYHIGARAHAEWFRVRGIFEEVVLFTDCCRDLEDNVPPTNPPMPLWPLGKNPEGYPFYAFPTMLGSKSYEKALGNPPSVRGIFSYVVVNALNNQKLYDDQGMLRATSLARHLYTTVPDMNGKQSPIIDYPNDPNKPEIVFAKWFTRARQKVNITFNPPVPGGKADLYRAVSTGAPFVAGISAAQGWSDELDAGPFYKIVIRGTDRSKLFEVAGNDEVQNVSL
jgi:hypothetical protein